MRRSLVYKHLGDLDYELWRSITRLYAGEPLVRAYLLYDLVYELDRTDVQFEVHEGEIVGYVLAWRGSARAAVHVWGRLEDPAVLVLRNIESIITVHNEGLLVPLVTALKRSGSARVERYLDMVADERSFKPVGVDRAVRLDTRDERHVESFLKFARARGLSLTAEGARELLVKRRYYGVFEAGELVSVACAYLRLPEVWIAGDVHSYLSTGVRGMRKQPRPP